MMRRTMASMLAVVMIGSCASAQAQPGSVESVQLSGSGASLRWQTGQVLLYRVEHATFAADAKGDSKSETRSLLKITKRWQVTGVDSSGVATLQMSLVSMVQERTTPSGEVLRFDSANPDKGTPELKSMANFLNKTLATLRVDSLGKVVEVKQSMADASGYENELPFLAMLPGGGVQAGGNWERTYKITLTPPLGTGEKYDAVQKFTCKSLTGNLATISMATDLKAPPKAPADAIPLWQMMPQGELVFDLKAGRLHSAKLTIDKELKGVQGEDSSTKFQSTLTVTYAGDK